MARHVYSKLSSRSRSSRKKSMLGRLKRGHYRWSPVSSRDDKGLGTEAVQLTA